MPSRSTSIGHYNAAIHQRRSQEATASLAHSNRAQVMVMPAHRSALRISQGAGALPLEVSLFALGMNHMASFNASNRAYLQARAAEVEHTDARPARRNGRAHNTTEEATPVRNHVRGGHLNRRARQRQIQEEMEDLQAEYDDLDSAPAPRARGPTITFISREQLRDADEPEGSARLREHRMTREAMEEIEWIRREMDRIDGIYTPNSGLNEGNEMLSDIAEDLDVILTIFKNMSTFARQQAMYDY
ncbi:hypothetical protein BJ508DRAFT_306749 [Ascobolus immersus RN42]|uniref:Uncharacterized protein n=1 Tax=Ascobolus immersus RN42 TaxID=1160509 RepID=A0A3N4I570_ASCIM|nr:hypothetical protein BJ508DRAFT_306749 [Ascobolus immersus RN42]